MVLERLKEIVAEMERGDWSPVSAAILVAEDAGTGMLTVVHMTENGTEDTKRLMAEFGSLYGYARVN